MRLDLLHREPCSVIQRFTDLDSRMRTLACGRSGSIVAVTDGPLYGPPNTTVELPEVAGLLRRKRPCAPILGGVSMRHPDLLIRSFSPRRRAGEMEL